MTKRARGCALFALATALAVGCGGTALNDGGGSLGGAAGASAQAGASGSLGHAGASSGGASSGGAGTAGAGGAATSEACSQPKQPGNCDAYAPSFWHNPNSGVCEPFIYGGCGGNDNRYATREACLAACPGGGSDWSACKVDEDCDSTTVSCCEPCEPVDIAQLVAVNQAHVSDQESLYCASSGACAPCPSVGELVETRKYFKPVCVSGQCSLIDVRQTSLTECSSEADCVLRNGAGCCSDCDGAGFIGANKSANFCDSAMIACAACATLPPKGIATNCVQGKCALTALL